MIGMLLLANWRDEEIIFDASPSIDAEGDINSYIWDFGNGVLGEGINPTHVYNEPGLYQVELTVIDAENKTSKDTTIVAIDQEFLDIEFKGGNGLIITFRNPSNYDLYDCTLFIEIFGGFQNMDYHYEYIDFLPQKNEYTLILPLIGFGKGSININFEDLEVSQNYFIIGPYVYIK